MATDAVRARTRTKSAGQAAKARREKIALVVGLLILAGLVAFEGPKTLKSLQGARSHATAPPATIAPGNPAAPAVPAPRTVDLKSLRGFAEKDPFKPQLGASTASSLGPLPAVPPTVRSSHFVAKDPFVQQLSVAPPTATDSSTPGKATPTGGYIVMLASVYVGHGRHAAQKAAAKARTRNVPHVGIVLSDNYPTLRTGFYAVYSGPYPTLDKALAKLQSIRGRGYVRAYTRLLGH